MVKLDLKKYDIYVFESAYNGGRKVDGIFKWVYEIGNWLAKLMYVHLLWVLFTLLGLVIFGITPATAAMVSVIHKWFDQKEDFPIFKHFFSAYKDQFIKANGVGLLLIAVGAFLYVDIRISQQVIQSNYFHAFLLFICFLYFITLLYFFTIFTRYQLRFLYYFRQSFLIAIARPFETIAMIICLVLLSYVYAYLPVLIILMGSSLTLFPVVWFGYRACVQVEEKKEKLTNVEVKS